MRNIIACWQFRVILHQWQKMNSSSSAEDTFLRRMLTGKKMNGMITCNHNAPSTRLTIPVSRNPNFWLADSLSRLRDRWYVRSVSARGRRHVVGHNRANCSRDRGIPLILCLQPLCRHILRGFLFLLRLRRWNFTQDYHAGLTAYDWQYYSSFRHLLFSLANIDSMSGLIFVLVCLMCILNLFFHHLIICFEIISIQC